MSVTEPRGFRASGVTAGLKASGRPDIALVVNDGPSSAAAAVYTSNRCKANPVLWSERASADGSVRAVVINSGGANCYTGPEGFQTTHATAEQVGALLGINAGDVVVCSTGLIGERLDRERLTEGVAAAVAALAPTGGDAAAEAIMTTDTRAKTAAVRRRSADPVSVAVGTAHTGSADDAAAEAGFADSAVGGGWVVGGIAKGAGMLAPGLATMLVVLTTDAEVDAAACDAALRQATRVTFDRLDTDGCMSTNDTVVLLASGASGVTPSEGEFAAAVHEVCHDLAMQLLADAEGAEHEIAIEVLGAASEADAVTVGRAVARSNLFKCAIFGRDPNWGRILAAVGTTDARFEPHDIDVAMNGVWICRNGQPGEPRDLVDLSRRDVSVVIDLKAGSRTATIWTTDLTHGYVHENSAYAT